MLNILAKNDAKHDVFHNGQIIFGKIKSKDLIIAKCYKSSKAHAVALNFKYLLAFYAFMTQYLPPYQLLFNVIEFLLNSLLSFSYDSGLGWLQASWKIWVSSSIDIMSSSTMAIVARTIKIQISFITFSFAACSTNFIGTIII